MFGFVRKYIQHLLIIATFVMVLAIVVIFVTGKSNPAVLSKEGLKLYGEIEPTDLQFSAYSGS